MANVSKINLYGQEYIIKDGVARNSIETIENDVAKALQDAGEAKTSAQNAQNTANSANDKANSVNSAVVSLKAEVPVLTYQSSDESIIITKGVN